MRLFVADRWIVVEVSGLQEILEWLGHATLSNKEIQETTTTLTNDNTSLFCTELKSDQLKVVFDSVVLLLHPAP